MILINNEIDQKIWNKLVDNKIFYRYEWIFVTKNIYKFEPYFVLLVEGDKFALIASFKTHKGYISLPFVSYSGFFANDENMLLKLKEYLRTQNIVIDSRDLVNKVVTRGYVNPIVSISSYETFWRSLSTNTRNQFKKSTNFNYKFIEENSINNFYKLYSNGMRNLGTPVHGKDYFINLMKSFSFKVFTIFDNNVAIGSMFCLSDKDTMAVLYAYVLPEYSKKYANYFLYLNSIKWMTKIGLIYLDMGRSNYGEGTFHFKKKFRPKFYAIKSNINYDDNTKLQVASSIWKKLPLSIANFIGPKIRRYLP